MEDRCLKIGGKNLSSGSGKTTISNYDGKNL
jgi:hypothetical protein